MIQQIETNHIPIKLWLADIESGAMEQAVNLAQLPFAFRHIALMPDAHQGFGMPIGGVLATKGAIIPNAVGVDIGCGMCAVRTDLHEIDKSQIKHVMAEIRETIPLGFKHHKLAQNGSLMPHLNKNTPIAAREYNNALFQLGSLGGGNHFIELQKGSDGFVWIMVHSGSRNIGKQVASHYNDIAVKLAPKMKYKIPDKWQLAYLEEDSAEAESYISEMNFCIQFAFASRKLMMDNVMNAIREYAMSRKFSEMINIAHNYAAKETHFGREVYIHRKGATSARKGEIGIIPGSQGTKSYIVSGLGNPGSFMSCSHGAGRVMGRNEAVRTLNLQQQIDKLNRLGIVHAIRTARDLEEAPDAYKNIETVMKNQSDLVEIVTELSPLAVVKG